MKQRGKKKKKRRRRRRILKSEDHLKDFWDNV